MSSYAAIPGFFIQDAELAPIEALLPHFGLTDTEDGCWHRFQAGVNELNAKSPPGASIKVLFLGRHGEGFHNVGLQKYGAEEWIRSYARGYGDEEMTWAPDARLTPFGHIQAAAARETWKREIQQGIPIPQKYYVSPLRRALETWTDTFGRDGDQSILPEGQRTVTVLEYCRETCGIYPCDQRLPLSTLQKLYSPPTYHFENGFSEEDLLWSKDERETEEHLRQRAKHVLDIIFNEPETYISVTTHGWFIRSLLAVINHAPYRIPTGGILPVVVKQNHV